MALKNIGKRINVIIKVYKEIPKSFIIDLIVLLTKLLPLFIITHDYNINHGTGISFFLRKLILIKTFAEISSKAILQSISIALLIIAIIILVSLLIIFNNAQNYEKMIPFKKIIIKIISFILFFIFYLSNQFIFSLLTEEVFCPGIATYNQYEMRLVSDTECVGVFYYCMSIVIALLGMMTVVISMSVNNIYNDICFRSEGVNVASLNRGNYNVIVMSLLQIVLQLEYHLDYTTMLYIKTSIRIAYALIYVINFYSLSIFFSCYYINYLMKLIYSMCFVSCVIEWCFYYDIDHHMTILLQSRSIIIIKLITEMLLAKVLLEFYIHREKNQIRQMILTCLKNDSRIDLNIMQKLLFIIYYRYLYSQPFHYIATVGQEAFEDNIHSPKCEDDCLFCIEYNTKDYLSQLRNTIDAFIDNKADYAEGAFLISRNGQHLNQTFSLMHSFIEMIICRNINKNYKGDDNKEIEALFICAMFYYFFEGNHYKSLFYIEQITKTKVYIGSVLLRLQINIFRYKIICSYKKYRDIIMNGTELSQVLNDTPYKIHSIASHENHSMKYHSIKEMHVDYQCIEKIIKGENLLRNSLNDYMTLIHLMSNELITYSHFSHTVHAFELGFIYNQVNINALFGDGTWSSLPYSPEKFWLYYGYFGHKSETKAIDAIRKYFNQNLLCLDYIPEANHIIVLNATLVNEKMVYSIEYLSDSLLTILKYLPSKGYNLTHFNDLLSKLFIKPYNHYLTQCIKNGKDRIVINNFCLNDKEGYALLYNFTGVTLYAQNTMKIFVEIEDADYDISIEKGKPGSHQHRDKGKSKGGGGLGGNDNNSYCGTCFLYTKYNGRIVSICKDFDTMFYLSSAIIQRYNINIKEILHIEQLSKRGVIERDLIEVFRNIINLNMSQIGSSGEDEFSMQIVLLKEVLDIVTNLHQRFSLVVKYEEKQLPKNDKRMKRYYMFILSIKSSNADGMNKKNSDMIFLSKISKNALAYGNIPYEPTHTHTPNANTNIEKDLSPQHKLSDIKSAVEKEEMYTLILLIKLMSFKFIEGRYRIHTRKKVIKKQIKEIDCDPTFNRQQIIKGNKSTSTQIRKEVYFTSKLTRNLMKMEKYFPVFTFNQKYYSFIYASITLVALVILTLSKITAADEQKYFFHSLSYLELSRNCVTGLVSTILYMLFQGNNLQEETIDNGNFNNSFEYYKTTFNTSFTDYNNYQGLLRPFLYEYSQTFHPIFKDCLMGKFPVIFLAPNNKAGSINESFGDLHFIGIMLRELEESDPVQVFFNRSDGLYVEVGKNKDFYAEAAYVKMIENYIMTNKYLYLELINSFPETIIAPQFYSRIWISIACLCLTIGLLFVGIVVAITHINHSLYLFAKHLITFIEFRFFQEYLEKKTTLILHYIQNNGVKKNLKGSLILEYAKEKESIYSLIEFIAENPKAMIKLCTFQPIQLQPMLYNYRGSSKNLCSDYNNHTNASIKNDHVDTIIKQHHVRSNTQIKSNAGVLGLIKSKAELKASITLTPMSPRDLLNLSHYNEKNTDKETENDKDSEPIDKPLASVSSRRKSVFFNLNNNSSKAPLSISSNTKILKKLQSHKNNNNISNQSMNMSAANLLSTTMGSYPIKISSYFSNGKPLLDKANEYFVSLLLLSFSFSLLIVCAIYNILGTYKNRDDILQMFVGEFSVFNQINFVSEMILVYQISVLKNKEVEFDYVSHGYINNCPETQYANDLITHNVFEELVQCYHSTRDILTGIVNGNFHYGLQNLGAYQKMIDTEDLCVTYSQFFSNSKSLPKEYDLFLVGKESEETLLHECVIIGDGLNSKGITNVLDSMYTNIIALYTEFLNDPNRTEKSNYARLNNQYIQTFQAEILTVLHKIPMHYIISLLVDYEYLYTQLKLECYLLTIGEIILVVLIAFQFIFLIYKYNRENHDIEFMEECLLKTILF